MTQHSQGIVDPLDVNQVLAHQEQEGIKFTFTVSTNVTGHDEKRAVIALKNQVRDVKAQLLQSGLREAAATEFLAPAEALVEDSSYWRLQSRGLVLFLADGFFLSVECRSNSATVSRPVNVSTCSHSHRFSRATEDCTFSRSRRTRCGYSIRRNIIEELPLENVPASFDEVINELPERALDVRPGSAGTAGTPSFHGPDGDIDRMLVEKYVHAVGQAIGTRLGTARSKQRSCSPPWQSICPSSKPHARIRRSLTTLLPAIPSMHRLMICVRLRGNS